MFLAVLTAGLLTACNSAEDSHEQQSDLLLLASNDHNSGSSVTDVSLAVPGRLRSVQNIDPAALSAIAVINGAQTPLTLNASGQFVGQIAVPASSSVLIALEFYETYANQQLILASAEKQITTDSTDTSVTLSRDEYNYDAFDFDGDNVSNIVERENNTSPLDPAQWPQFFALEVIANRPAIAVGAGYSDYDIEVTVGNEVHTLAADVGEFRRTFQVVGQSDLLVAVKLIEKQSGQRFVIGTQSESLASVTGATTVVFRSTDYDLGFDQDADGSSDLSELIAGTDILGTSSNTIAYSVNFDIPSEISNTASTYAVLLADGQPVSLVRSGSTYVASTSVARGAPVGLEVTINDTYENNVVTLATFAAGVQPVDGQVFNLQDFSLQHDTDNDGVLNFQELSQGSDPFSPPVGVCSPVEETIELTPVIDAYLANDRLFNNLRIQIDGQKRVGLMRFQTDAVPDDVTRAELVLTVGSDSGEGLISIFALPDFQWSDQGTRLEFPPLGTAVSSAFDAWDAGDEYRFEIPSESITADFTLVLTQEPGSEDVGFRSSETSEPPVLQLTVSSCL